eukprot:jgi/Ulvmu1/1682/UM115_0011.1
MTKSCLPLDEAHFARFSEERACQNTIQHWQLRDLVQYDPRTHTLFTACSRKIVGFNLHTQTAFDVVSASPRSRSVSGTTTFAIDAGYLATGTDKGELSVYDVKEHGGVQPKPRFQGTVTRQQEVLNNLSIAPATGGSPGRPRLYACGNDRVVRCYSLDTMACVDELKQTVAVNCCSEDPLGRQLVTLGDDNMVHVYSHTDTGQWAPSRQMRVDSSDRSNACGMCCTWHPWGHLFATAFQCGHLLIWDARCCQAVATMVAPRAVRSVKFSAEPMDIVAFAEHEQAFHLVDARNFGRRQTLHASAASSGISGMAFADSGSRLFVGIDGRGVQEWSIDSAARRGFSVTMTA